MKANAYELTTVLGYDRQLSAPLFQRPYVWEEEKQLEPFWNDLRSVTDQLLRGEVDVRPHFLGAVVLEQLSVPVGTPDSRSIIDGQQRLTTLEIFLAAFKNVCQDYLAGDDLSRQALGLIRNAYSKDPAYRFKVWPTNIDREAYKAVMDAESNEHLRELLTEHAVNSSSRIVKAYRYFNSCLSEWAVEGPQAPSDRLEALLNAVSQKVRLVVIDMDKDDDAQVIFETLNARGTPLLPSDLVKNQLLRDAQKKDLDVQALYDKYWKPFEDEDQFWRKDVRQGRLMRPQIDIFVAHYLALKRRDIISVPHLFSEFRSYLIEGDQSAEESLLNLREYATTFRRFDDYSPTSREGVFFSRLEALDTNMVIPVLLEVLKSPSQDGDHIRFIEILESYLVRRAICSLTYKNYNRVFADLLRHLSRTEFRSDRLQEFLLSREGETSVWPSDNDFRHAIETLPAYQKLKRSRVCMLLKAFEASLYQGKSERIEILDDLTVEHIMPQKWIENWPIGDNSVEAREARETLLHTFGNLTLVTDKLNPSLSNAGWNEKRQALQQYSALALNRELHDSDTWNEETIRHRNRQIADTALRIWPRE